MTQKSYDFRAIEEKWQKAWEETRPYRALEDDSLPKYYVLDMFPYPSGAGLHVGHVTGYTATDVMSRFKRQQGFNVLHPMGWDSFGLPAEQYAVRTGTHPEITTEKNVATYRRQLKSLGFSYDWEREFATSEPSYYKWTQWIFTQMYEKGLAYEAEMLVNYCPKLGTVLANEEVEDGKSIVGGYPVERRPLRQWVLKITEYAERLLEDIDSMDWPKHIKTSQKNWIGKSEGAEIFFKEKKTGESIPVFTTRSDTLFGATFLVLSPEHPLVPKITETEQKEAVESYQQETAKKSDLERTDLAKDKSGVWTGAYCINPANGEEIPIWIADYVLLHYGTGAIMAVASHDERDNEFAKKFSLPIRTVIQPKKPSEDYQENFSFFGGEGEYIQSKNDSVDLSGLSMKEAKTAMNDWLEKEGKGKRTINYKLRDWLFSRQRYWGEPFPILHLEDGTTRTLSKDELPLLLPKVTDFKPSPNGESPLAKSSEWIDIQDPKSGKKAKRETNTMPQWAGSCWYFLRFCDPQNTEEAFSKDKESYWMPVDLYMGGAEHAVTHLLYARFWHKVLYDLGFTHEKEPFKRFFNVGMVTSLSYKLPSGAYVPEEEVEKREEEYFHKESGEKLRVQLEKMSKSKLNGVTPDDMIERFGADSLRLYEMFMGPLDKEKQWNSSAIQGCHRFLQRVFQLAYSEKVSEEEDKRAHTLACKMFVGVKHDIEKLLFNTAIAKMMEFLNDFSKLPSYPKSSLKMLLQALYPFAPHITSELWEHLGFLGSVICEPLPEVDLSILEEEKVTFVVQVNGKLRARMEVTRGAAKEQVLDLAKEESSVQRHLDGKELKRVIFVPNKLLNLVV